MGRPMSKKLLHEYQHLPQRYCFRIETSSKWIEFSIQKTIRKTCSLNTLSASPSIASQSWATELMNFTVGKNFTLLTRTTIKSMLTCDSNPLTLKVCGSIEGTIIMTSWPWIVIIQTSSAIQIIIGLRSSLRTSSIYCLKVMWSQLEEFCFIIKRRIDTSSLSRL